jgi:hypothetical protein
MGQNGDFVSSAFDAQISVVSLRVKKSSDEIRA